MGLEGSVINVNGVKEEAFQLFLGGGVGEQESFGRRTGLRILASELPQSLVKLFHNYQSLRQSTETFQQFCQRHSTTQLVQYLSPDTLLTDDSDTKNRADIAAD